MRAEAESRTESWTARGGVRWLGTMAGALLLGSLGSGLWEYPMRPLALWGRDALLNAITLGVRAYRDSLYRRVALGHHEGVAISMFSFGGGLLAGAMIGCFGFLVFERIRSRGANRYRRAPPAILRWRTPAFELIGLATLAAVTTGLLLQINQVAYVSRAVAHVRQLEAVIAPVVSEADLVLMRSQFAQIGTREDYIALVTRLEETATAAGLTVPEFEPF